MSVFLLVIVIAGVLGAHEFRRAVRRNPDIGITDIHKNLRYVIPASLVAVGLVIILIASEMYAPLAWRLPIWFEFHHHLIVWGIIFGLVVFLFVLGVAASFHSSHQRRWTLLISGLFLVGALLHMNLRIYSSIAPSLKSRVDSRGTVLQTTGISCAAATGANMARHYGIQISEREMAELLRTNMLGTSVAQIIHGMKRLGISCRKVEVRDRDPLALRPPAMLFVDHPAVGSESHVVVFWGVTKEGYRVCDPAYGELILTQERIRAMWPGRALECRLRLR